MNAKTLTSAVLVGLCWACAVAHGQESGSPAGVEPPPIKRDSDAAPGGGAEVPSALAPATGVAPQISGLSDWIRYKRPDCCAPGPLAPIYSEAYLRVGPSVTVGGGFLNRNLAVGWTIEGGVRGLFFNPQMTSAWVVDAGIANSNNGYRDGKVPFILSIFEKDQTTGNSTRVNISPTIRNFNRTLASLGFGKDWYLWAPANAPGSKWRVGLDAGGRYGASDMTFVEIRHRTDTLYGGYTAAHTDFEVPCGCCTLYYGARIEWAATYTERVLQRTLIVQDLNFLATFGVRY